VLTFTQMSCCPAVPCADLCVLQAHGHSCTRRQGETCICCLLEGQLFRQLYGNRGEFRPDSLYSHLLSLNRGFVRGRQEDAHELLRCLTDELERCLLRQSLGYNPQRMPRVRCRAFITPQHSGTAVWLKINGGQRPVRAGKHVLMQQ
jgi:hypothetical protein